MTTFENNVRARFSENSCPIEFFTSECFALLKLSATVIEIQAEICITPLIYALSLGVDTNVYHKCHLNDEESASKCFWEYLGHS